MYKNVFWLYIDQKKQQRPFRTSNFSTFLFTVLVDGAKPSTNFPREAGREAALKISSQQSHRGPPFLHRVPNATIAHTSVVRVFFLNPGSQLHNEWAKKPTTTTKKRQNVQILKTSLGIFHWCLCCLTS